MANHTGPEVDRRVFLRALGAFALGFVIDAAWARAVRGPRLERADYPRVVLGRYRVHHSVVGYLLVLIGVFAYPAALVSLGLGIIVGHWVRDRLWFLERVE